MTLNIQEIITSIFVFLICILMIKFGIATRNSIKKLH